MNKERHLAAEILELFEQFLSERNIIIERDDDDDGCDDKAILYGEDYYTLEDAITSILTQRR